MAEAFEDILTGGHSNSLGRTVEVVEMVLANPDRFDELFNCYKSDDAVVRLRTSNAMKRLEAERRDLLLPYIDQFIDEVGSLDQASAQWTLAQLLERLTEELSQQQRAAALKILKRNLERYEDWIVLNSTMETLAAWATSDRSLKEWLKPHLERLTLDKRKSVASRAAKKLKFLGYE